MKPSKDLESQISGPLIGSPQNSMTEEEKQKLLTNNLNEEWKENKNIQLSPKVSTPKSQTSSSTRCSVAPTSNQPIFPFSPPQTHQNIQPEILNNPYPNATTQNNPDPNLSSAKNDKHNEK